MLHTYAFFPLLAFGSATFELASSASWYHGLDPTSTLSSTYPTCFVATFQDFSVKRIFFPLLAFGSATFELASSASWYHGSPRLYPPSQKIKTPCFRLKLHQIVSTLALWEL